MIAGPATASGETLANEWRTALGAHVGQLYGGRTSPPPRDPPVTRRAGSSGAPRSASRPVRRAAVRSTTTRSGETRALRSRRRPARETRYGFRSTRPTSSETSAAEAPAGSQPRGPDGRYAPNGVLQCSAGRCQRRGATSSSASGGPQVPGSYGIAGGGSSRTGCATSHSLSIPSARAKSVLSPMSAS